MEAIYAPNYRPRLNPAFEEIARKNNMVREEQRREEIKRKRIEEQAERQRQARVNRPMPLWAKKIIIEVSGKHGVEIDDVLRDDRRHKTIKCRNEIQYLMRAHPYTPSFPQIGKWMGRDHTSVLWSVSRHARDTGAPELTNYDADKVRLAANRRRARERLAKLRAAA